LNEKWPSLLNTQTIPMNGQIDIITLFVTEATLNQWQLQGVPSDE
jgi:hypothetical protein